MKNFYQWHIGKDAECLKGLVRAQKEENQLEPDDLISYDEVKAKAKSETNEEDFELEIEDTLEGATVDSDDKSPQ
jgi:hypothetical protein